ncbi:MAG: hypothetical protein R2736_03555 [Solirubrobacterales bacterium]
MGRSTRTVLLLAITGISLYLVFPSLLQVLSAWPRLKTLEPLWFIAMVVAEALSFVALWILQRLALRTDDTYAVATSQLAGNAFGRIVPGGGAAAGALQYRMLVQAGTPGGAAASGLTASSLLVFATLLALPVFALPAVLRGVVSTSNQLVIAALGYANWCCSRRCSRSVRCCCRSTARSSGSGGWSSGCATGCCAGAGR